jgi:hypothetical protein
MGIFWRRQAQNPAIHDLNLRLRQLDERLSALEAAHERLRGRFYALKGPETPASPRSKQEILAAFHAGQGKA